MKKPTIKLVPRIVLPRHGNGCDWSVDRFVVAQRLNQQLVWWPGKTEWAGLGLQAHRGASLLYVPDSRLELTYTELYCNEDGKRRALSRKLLQEVVRDNLFGVNIAGHWEPGKTVVIDG